jgi:non-homologous end joining protein Ku
MAPRPIWTGYLRLSLVSCPIRVYPVETHFAPSAEPEERNGSRNYSQLVRIDSTTEKLKWSNFAGGLTRASARRAVYP